jgi:hypothetical protein
MSVLAEFLAPSKLQPEERRLRRRTGDGGCAVQQLYLVAKSMMEMLLLNSSRILKIYVLRFAFYKLTILMVWMLGKEQVS